jgi:hypothetical protein
MRDIEQFGDAPAHVSRGMCSNRWNPDSRQLSEQGGGIPSWATTLYDGGGAGANWGSDGMFGGGDMSANTGGGKGDYYDLWNSIRDTTPGGLLSDHYGWSAEYGGAPGGRLDLDLFLRDGSGSGWGGGEGIRPQGGSGTATGTTGSTTGTGAGASFADLIRRDWLPWLAALLVILILNKKRGTK